MPEQALTVVEAKPLATMETAPAAVLAEAQKAAAALLSVIKGKKRPVVINGEQYLEASDWVLLGRFYAVTSGIEVEPEYVEINGAHGFKATSIALSHGQVISRATAYCMDDEERWSKAPTYQLASMAQTRANAKALRNVLSFASELAGFAATPAEEMDGVKRPAPQTTGPRPVCPKCKTAAKVMPSKFADKETGVRPWFCLKCSSKWGNSAPDAEPEIFDGPQE